MPRRPREGRVLTGVCAGVANSFQFNVFGVRVITILLLLKWPLIVFLGYLCLWLLLPEDKPSLLNF